MKKLLLFFIFLLFSFCSKKRENDLPRIIVPEQKNVVEVNSKEMLQNITPLLALNFKNDTIALPNVYGTFFLKSPKCFRGLFEKATVKRYDLKIFIDTTYKFSSQGLVFKNLLFFGTGDFLKDSIKKPFYRNKLPFDTIRGLQKKFVSAYPILFYNNSNKKIPLGTSDLEVKIIQEAKDIDGKWKPIEFYNTIGGCLGNLNLLLEPKHYTAGAIIKYKGNFKTKIRVKYFDGKNRFYSNEISGTINRSQFNQQYLKNFIIDVKGEESNLLNYNVIIKWMLLEN